MKWPLIFIIPVIVSTCIVKNSEKESLPECNKTIEDENGEYICSEFIGMSV